MSKEREQQEREERKSQFAELEKRLDNLGIVAKDLDSLKHFRNHVDRFRPDEIEHFGRLLEEIARKARWIGRQEVVSKVKKALDDD
jgi:hypothetical protein